MEEKPFGWTGEANGPTKFGRAPGYTSRTISSFDDLSAPAWDGTGGGAARVNSNLGEPWFDQQMGTPLQTRGANFEGHLFFFYQPVPVHSSCRVLSASHERLCLVFLHSHYLY